MNKSPMDMALDALTLFGGIGAAGLAGVFFWDRFSAGEVEAGPAVIRDVDDWRTYAAGGRRVGADDPVLTIVEFGDYQCSFCREFQNHVDAVLRRHPDDVAFVYRHSPLPGNALSYSAARVAECAGEQGRFWSTHALLIRESSWVGNSLERIGMEAEVGDMSTFMACISASDAVEAVERDLELAIRLEVPGTPTVLMNERLTYGVVDSLFLFGTVDNLLRREDRE